MPRRYDSEEAKRRILSSSVRLFILKGYHDTRIADIIAEANVSTSTFHNIFCTKDGILTELLDFMFENQFDTAARIVAKDDPVLLYAVETAVQMVLTERNEKLREIYLEAYTQPHLAEQIHRKTAAALVKIFGAYLPDCSESDFYELEIGTAGMMCGYMARPCDIYFGIDRKLTRFLRMSLTAYRVPREEQDAVLAFLAGLDITRIADGVMQKLFSALAMKFDFSLSPSDNPPTAVNQ